MASGRLSSGVSVIARHRVSVASWTVLSVVVAALVFYANTNNVYPVHHAQLNDGGVWVTSSQLGILGRENRPVGQADSLISTANGGTDQALDVRQNGSAVLNVEGNTITPVDVTLGKLQSDQAVSANGSAIYLGGSTVASLDPSTGRLWLGQVNPDSGDVSLSGLAGKTQPVFTAGGGAVGAVSTGGTPMVASGVSQNLVIASPNTTPVTTALSPQAVGGVNAVTAVGEHPIVMDSRGTLILGNGQRANAGTGALLQQPGDGAAEVVFAAADGLKAASLSTGAVRALVPAGQVNGTATNPVVVGGCAFGAWYSGTTGFVESNCGSPSVIQIKLSNNGTLQFRVNRNQILLNDIVNGSIWAVSAGKVTPLQSLQQARDSQKNNSTKTTDQQQTTVPPKVPPVTLGARANGSTTVLHVLDDAMAASGSVLAITDVKAPDNPAVQVVIGPDRQTLLATVATGATGPINATFTVDDGLGHGSQSRGDGQLTLNVQSPTAPSDAPVLRDNYKDTDNPWVVAAGGGTLDLPVAADWRNKTYGDPVVVKTVAPLAPADGSVSILPTGVLHFVAPNTGASRDVALNYTVSSGGVDATHTATVHVVGPNDPPRSPLAENDVVSGVVGASFTVHPLDNDIPGADGKQPLAQMKLLSAGGAAGLNVSADTTAGTITINATQAGTFVLTYQEGEGSAATSTGKVRVDIAPPSANSDLPVTAPSNVVVRGTAPAVVDVLANSYDPMGRVLVVQDAAPVVTGTTPSTMDVSVVSGRWIRVTSSTGAMTPTTQTVQYDISNGVKSVQGTVTVTQLPAWTADDAPILEPNEATVRSGDAVDVPVLDNASTPSGNPVALIPDPTAKPMGELKVVPPIGHAYVSGSTVRYVPPATVAGPTDVQINYVVANANDPTASTAVGTLTVHVTPRPGPTNPDQAPTPRPLTGRAVQGSVVTVKLPTFGNDPDGDSVSITGIGSAPQLGRVLATQANSITYQAFPTSAGTDSFTYIATDPFGQSSTGTVQIGVVPPGAVPAPVAQNVNIKAAPGRQLNVDVLASALRPQGAKIWLDPMTYPGASISDDQAPITIKAPSKNGDVIHVPFTVENGVNSSSATLTITAVDGYDNPPQVNDLVATPKPGDQTVTVDVLSHVYDPDNSLNQLKITSVGGTGATIKGGSIVLPVTDMPGVFPFTVVDSDGGSTSATIFVPPNPGLTPYLKPGAHLNVDPGGSVTSSLADLVVSPSGKPLYLTTSDTLSAAPTSVLTLTATDRQNIKVAAAKQNGPGSVSFQVSDSQTLSDPKAHTAIITVPVQVGPDVPIITCPSGTNAAVPVYRGGDPVRVDVAAVCQVWTSDPAVAASLKFDAAWAQSIPGVTLDSTRSGFMISAAADAALTAGTVTVSTGGSNRAAINVSVRLLPPPTLAALPPISTQVTQSVSLDLAQFVHSYVSKSKRRIVITNVSPSDGVIFKGSTLTFTPTHYVPVVAYTVTINDAGGANPGTSSAQQVIVLTAIDRPSKVTGVNASAGFASKYVTLTWSAPQSNGSPIDSYEIDYTGGAGGGQQTCPGSPCNIQVGNSPNAYTFTVKAHNGAVSNGGFSDPSDPASGYANTASGPVLNMHTVREMDGHVTIAWDQPSPGDWNGTPTYEVTWPGGSKSVTAVPSDGAPVDVTGLTDGTPAQVTVVSVIKQGDGRLLNSPSTTLTVTAAGKPDAPPAPTATPSHLAGNNTQTTATVTSGQSPNLRGKAPAWYQFTRTVTKSGSAGESGSAVVCDWQQSNVCSQTLPNDGTVYSYTVEVRNDAAYDPTELGNQADHTSAPSAGLSVEAAGQPDPITIDNQFVQSGGQTSTGSTSSGSITFTVGASHGAANNVTCTLSPGGACPGWPQNISTSGGGPYTVNFPSLSNGTAYKVTLQACNGSGIGATSCSAVTTSASVTPYGAFPTPSTTASATGQTTASGTATFNPNGASAHLELYRNGSLINGSLCTRSGVGNQNCGWSDSGLSAGGTYRFTVKVVDDPAGHPGPARSPSVMSAQATITTPNPPQPSVSVSKGQGCGHAGEPACPNPMNNCNGPCTGWYVNTTTANFTSSSVSCAIWWKYTGQTTYQNEYSWTQGPNSTYNETQYWYGPGTNFYVSCNGVNSAVQTW